MKVFITGATGILGKRVVGALVSKNISVIGLSRSRDNSQLLADLGAESAEIDLFNLDALIGATRGCDAILHLATSIPKKAMSRLEDWSANDRIRIEGTKNIVQAMQKNNIKKFIGQSVTALYGQRHGAYVSEDLVLSKPRIQMLESAYVMEEIIKTNLEGDYILLRFGTFYAPDAFHTQNLLHSVKNGKLPLIGNGDFYWNFIHVDDASTSIVYCLENYDKLAGHTFNITDFKPLQFKDMLKELGVILKGKKPPKIPGFLAKLLLGKNTYEFLTNSYRIKRDPVLGNLKLQKADFITEISKGAFNKNPNNLLNSIA